VDGKPITRTDDFSKQITRYHPGDHVTLEIYRGGAKRTAEVTLSERPNSVSSK